MSWCYLLVLMHIQIRSSQSTVENYMFKFSGNGILNEQITNNNNDVYMLKEISSCSSKPNTNHVFCIGDGIIEYKHIFEFQYDQMKTTLHVINIIPLAKAPDEEYMDTESLLYLQHDNVEFFMIITEGNREDNRSTHIHLYNVDGSYNKQLNYPKDIIQENQSNYLMGCVDNECIEASDVWFDANGDYWLILATESPLIQDKSSDNARSIRIFVARILFNKNDISVIQYNHAFIYDLESASSRLKDIIIINDNLDVIVMEMKSYNMNINDILTRDGKLFFAENLKDINNRSNVLNNCSALYISDCDTQHKIQKRLLFEFKSSAALNDIRCSLSIQKFDVLTSLKYNNNNKRMNDPCPMETVIIISDSDEISHYIVGDILSSNCQYLDEYNNTNCTFTDMESIKTNIQNNQQVSLFNENILMYLIIIISGSILMAICVIALMVVIIKRKYPSKHDLPPKSYETVVQTNDDADKVQVIDDALSNPKHNSNKPMLHYLVDTNPEMVSKAIEEMNENKKDTESQTITQTTTSSKSSATITSTPNFSHMGSNEQLKSWNDFIGCKQNNKEKTLHIIHQIEERIDD